MTEEAQSRMAVVGSSGFIGRALVARLRSDGIQVAAISRRGDVTGGTSITSYLDVDAVAAAIPEGVRVVFHLAALAHRRNVDDEAFVRANVDTALAVARAAIARGATRFVFVSSIGVLGNEDGGRPFDEHSDPHPIAPYARSKWLAERALQELLDPTNVDLVIVRPPLVHGPDAPGNFGALARLVRRPLPLPFGSVTDNARSLIGIDNLVDFLISASWHPDAPGQALLVSDGKDVSTAILVAHLVAAGGRARLVRFPPRLLQHLAHLLGRTDTARQLLGSLRVDASASMRRLGWSPLFSLEQGLTKAMNVAP